MTRFDNFKLMTMDQLVEWLDNNGQFDGSPWMEEFDKKYCNNCEAVMCHYEGSTLKTPFAWCELEGKCKFFPDMDHTPNNKDIIRIWLESEGDTND